MAAVLLWLTGAQGPGSIARQIRGGNEEGAWTQELGAESRG
jgi:hypothetical protein